MPRLLSLLLAAACLLLPALDAIAQSITRVYRADARPPHEIFLHGFQGRGANMDLLAHTLGASCEETNLARASTWVSTSAERETAVGFAMGHLESLNVIGPRSPMYIYTIRADHTFVDVRGVMRRAAVAGHVGQQGYTAAQAQTLEHLIYSTVIGGEEEVVTHNVEPANILSAQIVYFDAADDFVEEAVIVNPDYRPLHTQASDVVADLHAFVPPSSIREDYGSDSDSDSSCSMTCDGTGGGVSSRVPGAVARASTHCEVRRGPTPMLLDLTND